MSKYFLYELTDNINKKYETLLNIFLSFAESATLNILWPDWYKYDDLKIIKSQLLDIKKVNKILTSSNFIHFKINEDIKELIKKRTFEDWKNYYLEDLSLIYKNVEYFTVKSRKNQIVLLLNEKKRKELIDNGFDIWFEISSTIK